MRDVFARDEVKAYYLDSTDKFIRDVAVNSWKRDFEIWDIPLVSERDSLLGRWWNLFHHRNFSCIFDGR